MERRFIFECRVPCVNEQWFFASDSSSDVRDRIRVAAVQFATGTDVDENLATCVRMIDRAAAERADLVVLPEFSNHLSIYDSADHCWDVAVDLDGPFIEAIADRARHHGIHVVVTVSARRVRPTVTITNCWIDPTGTLVATTDKQVLMGGEREHLSPGSDLAPVVSTGFGLAGMYSCMEGVVPETPRSLAIRGARLLTNSLNSFALDEASLHVPVRAAENGVFVVAANKVGPLIPPDRLAEFSAAMGLPPEAFNGAGESQVVAPDGSVVAKGPRTGEAVVVADIDLSATADRTTAGGADRVSDRRPEAYVDLGHEAERSVGADEPISVLGLASTGDEALAAVAKASHEGIDLVVLPELAVDDVARLQAAVRGSDTVVVSTLRDGAAHRSVVVGAGGVIASGRAVHRTDRLGWATELGDRLVFADLAWGRLAVVAGDDALFPESFRLAAVAGASVVAVTTHLEDPWLVDLGLVERSAENRLNLVVGSRPGVGGPMVVALPPDFTLWLPGRDRPYDGTINTPDLFVDPAAATVVPARAANRQISRGTDLVGGRPMPAARSLTEPA
jgi:predicted amidohydrolase